jgi:hypothetical protein
MGLDAVVYCNCVETGRLTVRHPYPELLYIDRGGSPEIRSEDEEKQDAHDRWLATSPCRHDQCILLHHYIGNIALVEHLRRIVSQLLSDPEHQHLVIWKRVIHNGVHSGDWLDSEQVVALRCEIQRLRSCDPAPLGVEEAAHLNRFLSQMEELVDASMSVGKPIAF